MKKCVFGLLILCLLFCRISQIEVSAATKEEDPEVERNLSNLHPFMSACNLTQFFAVSNPNPPANTIAKGVDISHHNGVINFAKLKQNVDFVIIRCGYGMDLVEQDDTNFEDYVRGCVANDIPFGVYFYSYADTVEKAKSEAEHTLRLLNKCKEWNADLSLPVFYDMEDDIQKNLSAELKAEIASTYCSILNSNGYITGIYANIDWWRDRLTDPYFDTVPYRWIARYNDLLGYGGNWDMWQCSETATLENMPGDWDLNYMFTNMLHTRHPALQAK